jgi:hypothetical protein
MPKAFLLCLFVLLTPVDDAWARATPTPDDDAWAAENNDFLPQRTDEAAPRPPDLAPGYVLKPAGTGARPPAVPPAPWVFLGPDPLYLLMSLQR